MDINVRKWSTPLMDLAAIVVVVAGLRAAAPIVTQLLLIALLVIILSPVYYWLVRKRLPSWAALTLIISALVIGVMSGAVLLANSFRQLAFKLPDYYFMLQNSIAELRLWLAQMEIDIPDDFFDGFLNRQNAGRLATGMFAAAQGLFAQGFIIILVTAFCLCELPNLPKLRQSRWMSEDLWIRCVHIAADVRHYMGIKTLISLMTGVMIYVGLVLLKIDSPFLLALLVFLLNYVPVIGSIVAAIPAVLMAWATFGMGHAAWVVVLYAVVNQIFGGILDPHLMGKGFGVSPVVILVSMLFWGFVLGPVGMVLSVPLTMGLRVVLSSLRELEEGAVA